MPWKSYDLSGYDYLSIDLEAVRHNFALFDLLDDQVWFLPGWFQDTLPNAAIERLAMLRIDADMFASTLDALSALYPKLAVGGYVIVDDYGVYPSCRHAVQTYRLRHRIREPIEWIDDQAIYWRKQEPKPG